MIKDVAVLAWSLIWASPFVVAICSDSCLLVAIAIVWGIILKACTKAYAPEWMQSALAKVFGTREW